MFASILDLATTFCLLIFHEMILNYLQKEHNNAVDRLSLKDLAQSTIEYPTI